MVTARERIKATMKGMWATPEMLAIAASERSALKGGYGDCLKKLMASGTGGRDAYRQCAEQNNISSSLSQLWA